MIFEVLDGDGLPVVKVAGELDANTVRDLEAALAPIIAGRPPRLVVDASELEFVDSSAVAAWVRWANLVGRLEIHHPSPALRATVGRLGLAHRLQLIPEDLTSSPRSIEPRETAAP